MEMYKGRQFFPCVHDENQQMTYCIGGFSTSEGALEAVERYSYDKKEWELVASMNSKRLNCSACMVGKNHIFVFGGRTEENFFDSVERLNIELNLWNLLKIRLPVKLCNTFSFTFNKSNILIMGGLRKYTG